MEQKGQIDKIKEEYERGEEKLKQEKRRLVREQNRQRYQKKRSRGERDPDYAARTKRLINKGGVFEHFYPETKEMTEPEFYQLIEYLNENSPIRAQIFALIHRVFSERRQD